MSSTVDPNRETARELEHTNHDMPFEDWLVFLWQSLPEFFYSTRPPKPTAKPPGPKKVQTMRLRRKRRLDLFHEDDARDGVVSAGHRARNGAAYRDELGDELEIRAEIDAALRAAKERRQAERERQRAAKGGAA